MIPEQIFQQILALGDGWRVERVDYVEKESKVLIRVEETAGLWGSECCPHCRAQTVGGCDHAPQRTWRHPNVRQLQSEIVCSLPRGQCKAYQKVYRSNACRSWPSVRKPTPVSPGPAPSFRTPR